MKHNIQKLHHIRQILKHILTQISREFSSYPNLLAQYAGNKKDVMDVVYIQDRARIQDETLTAENLNVSEIISLVISFYYTSSLSQGTLWCTNYFRFQNPNVLNPKFVFTYKQMSKDRLHDEISLKNVKFRHGGTKYRKKS